ncbi:hypothetical protein Tco_0280534 [Tanacetum coccineum]
MRGIFKIKLYLFEFDDNFKSSTINTLFDEIEEDIEIKNSNVSDEPVLLNTPLSDKVAQEDNNDEIDAFLAMEVSSNFEEDFNFPCHRKMIRANQVQLSSPLPVSLFTLRIVSPLKRDRIFLVPEDLIPQGVEMMFQKMKLLRLP